MKGGTENLKPEKGDLSRSAAVAGRGQVKDWSKEKVKSEKGRRKLQSEHFAVVLFGEDLAGAAGGGVDDLPAGFFESSTGNLVESL